MAKIITKAVKTAATRDYVTGNKTLKEVSLTHGINPETLRRILGNRVRPRGTRYLADGTIKTPITKNGRKLRVSSVTYKTPNSNRRWTTTEDEVLKDARDSNMSLKETSDLLGRTIAAILSRKNHLFNMDHLVDDIHKKIFNDPSSPPVKDWSDYVISKPVKKKNVLGKPVIEQIVESVKTHVSAPAPTNSIELAQLAQIVKDFGVNITLSVTSEGTEVRMSK